MNHYIALDIGGSHITAGIVNLQNGPEGIKNISHLSINSNASADVLLANITDCVVNTLKQSTCAKDDIKGLGISMPGPFDYERGISRITGVNKFESLFSLDLKACLLSALAKRHIQINSISFLNDAQAFLMGSLHQNISNSEKVLAVTIGTGIGSASYANGEFFYGFLDNHPLFERSFKKGRAEDYFSTNWFLNQAKEKGFTNGDTIDGVKELSEIGKNNSKVQGLFDEFGKNLAVFLNGLLSQNKVDRIVFGGKVFQSFHLFSTAFRKYFANGVEVQIIDKTSEYSLIGAALHHKNEKDESPEIVRNSVSPVLPLQKETEEPEGYDMYPTFNINPGIIKTGYPSLYEFIRRQKSNQIVIDGNIGTRWDEVVSKLNAEFAKEGADVSWYCIDAAYKPREEIDTILEDYLGGDDPLFGFNYPGNLEDFFDNDLLKRVRPNKEQLSILYGTGAALAGWDGTVIYIDQPKNEIQYRSRAGSVTNIGAPKGDNSDAKRMYKQFYFVDWPVCNKHKQYVLPKLSAIVDGQRPGTITWMEGDEFRDGLERIVKRPFRVRPWFEPGVWGGQWMKEKFNGLNKDAENFAWSFEIIAPENGVIFESEGTMLEAGFEFLLYQNNNAVLGIHAEEYGYYFPLRFDYLDTMDGENLSLQCHPKLEYMRENFGEQITQDETYYIMDAEPDAEVYLGFQENINPDQFQAEMKKCEKSGKEADVKKYVQTFTSKKHDLFLIPAGTIHCSGKNNMVLEISNTPYIFTFKIYDWQRLDLDGKPRTLNVDRAFENLDFERKGSIIKDEFISKSETIEEGENWKVVNLSTHERHLYSVHRLEFEKSIPVQTGNRFNVLNLVEGDSVNIISNNQTIKLRYAETVVIPAATGEYSIENCTNNTAKVVKAFMK